MDPRAFLASLTADELTAPSLIHVRELPARSPTIEPFPAWIPPLVQDRLELLGIRGLYPHQADGPRGAGRRSQRGHGHRDGERQDARLQPGVRSGGRRATEVDRALPVPDEGARARPAPGGPRAHAPADEGGRVRRRHAARRAAADPQEREPGDDEPGHAAPGAARRTTPGGPTSSSASRLVVVDEAHVCRGVFGSHVAMVLRRLRRLVAHYGGTPRWCWRPPRSATPASSRRA